MHHLTKWFINSKKSLYKKEIKCEKRIQTLKAILKECDLLTDDIKFTIIYRDCGFAIMSCSTVPIIMVLFEYGHTEFSNTFFTWKAFYRKIIETAEYNKYRVEDCKKNPSKYEPVKHTGPSPLSHRSNNCHCSHTPPYDGYIMNDANF